MAEFEIETDDLSADAVLRKLSAEHDGVAERLENYESLDEQAEVATEAAEALDTEVDGLVDEAEAILGELEELRAFRDEHESEEKREHAEAIVDETERFGDVDDLMELDLDDLKEKHELIDELSTTTKTADAGDGSGKEPTDTRATAGRYARKPDAWR